MIQAVLFDLEGVLVTTDQCHYRAWKQMAVEQGLPFDEQVYQKVRGNGRMNALDIILQSARKRNYSPAEKFALTAHKNELYMEEIAQLSAEALLPGALETVRALREIGTKVAVVSSSQNCVAILKRMGLWRLMDAIVDGSDVAHPEPDPEGYLLAAQKLGVAPEKCLVVEDTVNGIAAANAAGMFSISVGEAAKDKNAVMRAKDLSHINIAELVACRTGEYKK